MRLAMATMAGLLAAATVGYGVAQASSGPPAGRDRLGPSVARPTAMPPTYVAVQDGRLAVRSSADGHFRRWLTSTRPTDIGLPTLTPDRQWVYYVATTPGRPCPSTYRVKLAGGPATLVETGNNGGAQPIAVGPKGIRAGNTACIASMYVAAVDASGTKHWIGGTREYGANGMAWAPDARHLAVSTLNHGTVVVNVMTQLSLGDGRVVPCPKVMPACTVSAPGYSPSGDLYTVATNHARTRAILVRRHNGVATVLAAMPHPAAVYHLSVSATGAVLVSGDPDNGGARSTFVVRWVHGTLTALPRDAVQVAW